MVDTLRAVWSLEQLQKGEGKTEKSNEPLSNLHVCVCVCVFVCVYVLAAKPSSAK